MKKARTYLKIGFHLETVIPAIPKAFGSRESLWKQRKILYES